MIELVGLEKIFPAKGGDVVALRGIDLTIEDGDVYGIIGLSGAGKSTLVRCINLLERPTAGQVLVDGEDLTKVTKARLREVRRRISMIFQQFNLLAQRTVLKNVTLAGEIAGEKHCEEKAKALLSLVP